MNIFIYEYWFLLFIMNEKILRKNKVRPIYIELDADTFDKLAYLEYKMDISRKELVSKMIDDSHESFIEAEIKEAEE